MARTGGKKTANSIEGKTMRSGHSPRHAAGAAQGTFGAAMNPVRPAFGALLGGLVLCLALAAPAAANCGGAQHRQPGKRLGDFRAPLIIGDSVLLGAMPNVAAEGFEVDTRGCRQWSEGAAIVRRRRHEHTLPHEVVMFLGADWTISMAQIREVLSVVGHSRVLVLLTPREVGGFGGSDAAHVRRAGRLYPGRVLVLDWVRFTRPHSGWFAPDGLHLGYGGAGALARFLREALPYAAPGSFPGPPTPPPPPATAPPYGWPGG